MNVTAVIRHRWFVFRVIQGYGLVSHIGQSFMSLKSGKMASIAASPRLILVSEDSVVGMYSYEPALEFESVWSIYLPGYFFDLDG